MDLAFGELQSEFVEVAHLVGVPGESSLMRLDVLGAGFRDCGAGERGHALPLTKVRAAPLLDDAIGACLDFEIIWDIAPGDALPADFDADGQVDGGDVDALVNAIVRGNGDSRFDLSGDGIVNGEDLQQWLAEAARENGFAAPYSLGDANLNGSVNASDLNALGQNWLGDSNAWQSGDFTADGSVDTNDLQQLARNWQVSIASDGEQATPVPECGSSVVLMIVAFIVFPLRRWSCHMASS